MNYLQIVQRVHSESGRSTAAPTSVVGANDRHVRLFNWVADAWRDLQGERDWRWMRNTLDAALTANQQTYSGADLGATRFGRWRKEDHDYSPYVYVDGAPNAIWPMAFWQLDQMRARFIYRTWGASTPIAWSYNEANELLIGPQPALPYKLRIEYWKEPSELAADADTPDMPDRFHMLLVWAALQEVAKFDAAPEVLARAEKNHGALKFALTMDQSRLPTL